MVVRRRGGDFALWAREQILGWSFDLATLTLRILHTDEPGDVSTLPLVPGELRERMLLSIREASRKAAATVMTLRMLAAEGLDEGDVEEILALVAFKKARSARGRGPDRRTSCQLKENSRLRRMSGTRPPS